MRNSTHRSFKSDIIRDLSLKTTKRKKSVFNIHINLEEIHDILQKNIGKQISVHKTHRKTVSEVTKYINKHKNDTLLKRISSPGIYQAFKVRCQSPLLHMKFSKPKILSSTNNFIVTQLKKPDKNNTSK